MLKLIILFVVGCLICHTCIKASEPLAAYKDVPYLQDYSIKYYVPDSDYMLIKTGCDRNGVIQVLSSDGKLCKPYSGDFLYPGTLEPDRLYRPMADREIIDLCIYDNQFVYLDKTAVLSNSWAGKLFVKHGMSNAKIFAGGRDFMFLVSDGNNLKFVGRPGLVWKGKLSDEIVNVLYASDQDLFWILGKKSLSSFDPKLKKLITVLTGENFTAFCILRNLNRIIIGTTDGYFVYHATTRISGKIRKDLPCNTITAVNEINGSVWFGSMQGAFMLREDQNFNYYYGERWIPSNKVVHIEQGPDSSVLVLTDKGLGQICFKLMTLNEKAMYFEKQVRLRHIRYGFNATLNGLNHGDFSTGYLSDSDNDGLWTSMYLGSQVFRYAVTQSEQALQNCIESLDAMERLYTVNPVPGFPARSFERSGYMPVLSDQNRWRHSPDSEWDWKATTSSDEAIGHIFALGVFAELIDSASLRARAVDLIDTLMSHIVSHDLYLIDYDGKPTTWGKWNPDYVNARPPMVGDRKLNSSNIIAMLQTAYYFTGKGLYREKALELMTQYGYFKNLMQPMEKIGPAPRNADDWSRMLSESWNHSDDEMYFLGYWGLYRYALNDSLKAHYRNAIMEHWKIERPEKEGAWNIFTAMVSDTFDLYEAVWYLREYPLDLISWDVSNSHRNDIKFIEPNFRKQTIETVLPPDERPIQRHNSNMFKLDKTGSNGDSEYSAGDIWLLPYWMGRFFGVIGN